MLLGVVGVGPVLAMAGNMQRGRVQPSFLVKTWHSRLKHEREILGKRRKRSGNGRSEPTKRQWFGKISKGACTDNPTCAHSFCM